MKLKIELPLKPFSVNATKTFFKGRMIPTREHKAWVFEVNRRISPLSLEMKLFAEKFNRKKHYFKIDYIFEQPKNEMFTKKGFINKTRGDTDNFIKTLQDVIFKKLEKYNSEIDDSQVLEFSARSFAAEKYKILVCIELRELPENKIKDVAFV